MDGKTHRLVGSMAGTALAGYKARDQDPLAFALELVGGYCGGRAGGAGPDFLEPATSPSHRMLAHSFAVGGGVTTIGLKIDPAVDALRRKAQEFAKAARASNAATIDAIVNWILFGLCHIAAGGINGLSAGYLSHLALDSMTPASLPLLFGPG